LRGLLVEAGKGAGKLSVGRRKEERGVLICPGIKKAPSIQGKKIHYFADQEKRDISGGKRALTSSFGGRGGKRA